MTHNVESCFGGLRNVAGSQPERANVWLPSEGIKFYCEHHYEHCDGQLGNRNKHVAEFFNVNRRGKKSVTVLRCVWQLSHPKFNTWCARMVSRTNKH